MDPVGQLERGCCSGSGRSQDIGLSGLEFGTR